MSVQDWWEPECSECGTYHNSSLYCIGCIAHFVFWLHENKIDLSKYRSKKKDWLEAIRETEDNIEKLFSKFSENDSTFLEDILEHEKVRKK